jgi:hypothetical protein
MPDPYWAAVGRQVEAIRQHIWAYRAKVAARDRATYERMRAMGKRKRKPSRTSHRKKAS